MGVDFGLGLFFIVLGGAMEGSFSLPLKYTPKWEWENTWGACSLLALLLVPWPLALLTVPNLWEVFRAASSSALVAALVFGAGWGIGGIFFWLSFGGFGMVVGFFLL